MGLLLANGLFFVLPIKPISAQPTLTWKWTRSLGAVGQTFIGPLAADLNNDGEMEIVVVGGSTDGGTDGAVTVLNGMTGNVVWQEIPRDIIRQADPIVINGGVGMHSPFEIADLDKNGIPEIVIAAEGGALVLHGNDGSLYWFNRQAPARENYLVTCDVDGDGYSEIFVCRGNGPYDGHDWITELSYDGKILRQAWTWHPCWGGMSIGDTNFDGVIELYSGDRRINSGADDPYQGGGMGIRALDARTLTPLWNDQTVGCSSTCPILADVDKDGNLDVVVLFPKIGAIVVLNSADGSVVTTGGKYRKGEAGMKGHSQPTVYDIDGDGNLEFIACNVSQPKIWDLYDWKLDGILNATCWEPPKVGDVTGDGLMDIIAMNGSNICIYDRTYSLVQNITAPKWVTGLSAFTLVQDVDGDELNELVVTSSTGTVLCYDTPAPAPNPRARSVNQFYSERRCGAAEYVPPPVSRALFNPPTQGNPTLVSSNGTNGTDENLIARNQSTTDSDGDPVTNIYHWSVNNTSFTNLLLPFDTRDTHKPPSFSDGFEYSFYNWNMHVSALYGTTIWDRTTTQKHSGEYSAHLGPTGGSLISDDIDASNAESITVSFWYRDDGLASGRAYLQLWLNDTYKSIFDLGNTSPEHQWYYYQVCYRTKLEGRVSDFRIRFGPRNGTSINSGGNLWIDDVSITLGDVSVTKDYSGYDNYGGIYGAAWTSSGVVGGAYYFDGSDYVMVQDNPSLGGDGTWKEITVEYWVKTMAPSRETTILAKKTWGNTTIGCYMTGFQASTSDPPNTIFWGVLINDQWVELHEDTTTVIGMNKWYHIVCTYESGPGLKIYINGTLTTAKAASGNITSQTTQLGDEHVYLGYDGGSSNRSLCGLLDEVRIYPKALTPEQIMQRYTESKDGVSQSSTIVAQETTVGDIWKCEVTPSDSFLDGGTKTSDTLTLHLFSDGKAKTSDTAGVLPPLIYVAPIAALTFIISLYVLMKRRQKPTDTPPALK